MAYESKISNEYAETPLRESGAYPVLTVEKTPPRVAATSLDRARLRRQGRAVDLVAEQAWRHATWTAFGTFALAALATLAFPLASAVVIGLVLPFYTLDEGPF